MILTEKEINNMPVNLGTLWIIKKSHIEALDKIKELDPYYYISKWEYYEDRTDQLAVIADALAVCCDPEYLDLWMDRCLEQAARADRAEAKLRELVETAEEKDSFIYFEEPGLPGSKERNDFKDAKYRAWKRYQAALEAAKEE